MSEYCAKGNSMKTYVAYIATDYDGSRCEEEFEMPDDATPEEIEAEAKEIAFNMCEWGYYEKSWGGD